MLQTWHLTEAEAERQLQKQGIERTQQARSEGFEIFAIGDQSQGKIIAVLAQPKSTGGTRELPRVLTEGTS